MTAIIVSVVALIVILIIGVPVPFAFFASSFVLVLMGGYDPSFLLPYGMAKGSSIILCAIPLFILAGAIMERANIADSLVDWVQLFVGKIKGGLGIVMVVACGLFGAISGSGAATISCIGSIMLPRMHAAKYPKGHITALIANAGVLGLLIPPSLTMILYSWVSGCSVLSAFLATVLPGIALIILFSIINVILLRNNTEIEVVQSPPLTLKENVARFGNKTKMALPAIFAPVIILGGIYGGYMTPTEAAAVSCVYSIPVGIFIFRKLTKEGFYDVLTSSAITTGVVMFMIISVQILSRVYVMENVPMKILAVLNQVSDSPVICLLIINLLLLLIGMLMDDASSILLATPLLLPVVQAFGVDPVQFAAIIGVNIGMANVTPPCAPFLYFACRIGNTNIKEVMRPTLILILFAWLPVLLLVTYVPGLATWLPNLLLGN